MTALAALRLSPLFALRLTDKVKHRLGVACLVAIGIGLAALIPFHHDPNDSQCKEPPHIENPDMPNPLPREFRMATIVTPGTVDLFNKCPGSASYSVGDFQFH